MGDVFGEVGSFVAGGLLIVGGVTLAIASGGTLSQVGIGLATIGLGLIERGVRLSQLQEGIQQNVTSTVAGVPVVYGRAKIGGKVVDTRADPNTDKNKDLYRVLAICLGSENGQGIEDVEEVYFDERLAISNPAVQDIGTDTVPTGLQNFWVDGGDPYVQYAYKEGTDAQTVESGKLNPRFPTAWPTTSEGKGIAYMAFQLIFHEDIFATGIPNITFKVKGNKVWDPRLGARSNNANWAYSTNPALCTLDFLMSNRYGVGMPEADINVQSFIDGANLSDELVQDGTGGTQKRFTCNGWLDTDDSLKSNLNSLLSSCRGQLVYQNGEFRLWIRNTQSPVSFELDETNIIGDWTWRRKGSDNVPNTITMNYVDERDDFAAQEAQWPEPGTNDFLTSDNDIKKHTNIDLPMTNDFIMAQQIAMVTLKETREDVSVEVTCTEAALQLEVGDVVPLSHSTPGFSSKEFWVVAVGINPDNTVRLGLAEYSDLAYSLDPQSDKPTVPGSDLPDPFTIAAPTNITISSGSATAVEFGDGTLQPRVLVTWTEPTDAFFRHVETRFRPVTDADNNPIADGKWQKAPDVRAVDDQQILLDQVDNGYEYEIEVRSVNVIGVSSAWVTTNHTVFLTGGHYPIILVSTEENSAAGTGTVDATVVDPGGGLIDVEFFTRTGRSVFSGTPDQTNTGVTSGSTVSYTTNLDPDRLTFVKVKATLQVNSNIAETVVDFDTNIEARIDNLDVSVDEDTGEVIVSADGDSDTGAHYITIAFDATPLDPDGTETTAGAGEAKITGRSGQVNTGDIASRGDNVYIKARPEDTNGNLAPASEIKQASTTYGDFAGHPIILIDTSESTTQGTVSATVIDPDGGQLDLRFYERQGHGSSYPATPDAEFPAVNSGTTESHTIDLVEKKNSWVKIEAEVLSNTKTATEEVVFDPDLIPELDVLSASANATGNVVIHAGGDVDVASIGISVSGDLTESLGFDGRTGSVTTAGVLEFGETISVTATPYSQTGQLGTNGTQKTIEYTRSLGEARPVVEVDATQSGTTGSLDLSINDPQLRITAVEFAKREGGADGFTAFASTWDRTTGTLGTDDNLTRGEDIPIHGKHNNAIKWRITYTDPLGASQQFGDSHTFDVDTEPEMLDLAATINGSGNVVVSAVADEDSDNIDIDYTGAFTESQNIPDRDGSITSTNVLAFGQEVTVTATANSGVTAGTSMDQVVRRDAGFVPFEVSMQVGQSGTNGTMDLTIEDPQLLITAVEFAKKTGSGDFGAFASTWDRTTGTAGTNATLTRGEDVALSEKHNSSLKYRITYNDVNGTSKTVEDGFTFDVDTIPEVNTLTATVNPTGTITVNAGGDEDVASMDVDITGGVIENGTISGRTGSYTTTGVLAEDDTANVTVTGYSGASETGTSGPSKSTKASRSTTGGEAAPTIEISRTGSTSSTITYDITARAGPQGVGPLEIFTSVDELLSSGGFASEGTGSSPFTVSKQVSRGSSFPKILKAYAVDNGASGSPRSDVTVAIVWQTGFDPEDFLPGRIPVDTGWFDPRGTGSTKPVIRHFIDSADAGTGLDPGDEREGDIWSKIA